MLTSKKGVSIISLALCALSIALVTSALVIATNNSKEYRAHEIVKKDYEVESLAYVKTYKLTEVEHLARQAYVNNYLPFYNKEVDLEGFYALVVGELMQTIPQNQLENFNIIVTAEKVDVEYR